MLLLVVEDRHGEDELRRTLASARARGDTATVLTGDALLAMRLRREGVDAQLTVDHLSRDIVRERDRIALDALGSAFTLDGADQSSAAGTSYGPYLQYTLIPAFIRAVRNVTAVDDLLSRHEASNAAVPPAPHRIVLVGGGPLVDAASQVGARRGLAVETAGGDFLTRAVQAVRRISAGRATRWVNTDLRALVLEPGFLWLLLLKGLWAPLASSAPGRHALVVVGDRFTADVVERLRSSAPIVLAGATQPGRALFTPAPGMRAIESFTELADLLRWAGWLVDAIGAAISLASRRAQRRPFVVAGVPCWPLVERSVWMHVLAWVPALRQLQALAARTASAYPDATLLTSTDVTAYNRVLIDTMRQFGIASTGIQHGILGQANGHSIVHVDRLATWGEESERWYREHATQTAEFVVTGNPRFDALARPQPPAPPPPLDGHSSSYGGPVRSAQGATAGSPAAEAAEPQRRQPLAPSPQPPFTITVCTGFVSDFSVAATEYENLMMLDAVIEWARQHPGTRVIHKMHPGEELAYYAAAAQALGWDPAALETIREPILYDVLARSSVMVASYSTTVLESIALGTPAIVVDAIVQYRLLPLDEIRGIGIAFSKADLHAQLKACLAVYPERPTAARNDPALVRYIGVLDGGAAERIASLLTEQ